MSTSRWQAFAAIVVAAWVLGLPFPARVAAAGVDDEYAQRVKELADDDIEGHLRLAQWCRQQEAWALLRDECKHILRLNPAHEQAKLYLELAQTHLGEGGGGSAGSAQAPTASGRPGEFARVINDDEVQVLRRTELGHMNFAERVSVEFKNDVVQRFANEQYQDRAERVNFLKLAPAAKAQTILSSESADLYAHDILVNRDPARLMEFERRVLPIVSQRCATAGCHNESSAQEFRLYTGRNLTTNEVYTDYLILTNFTQGEEGKERMINREHPQLSLLLYYGLRGAPVTELTPSPHPTMIDPAYQSPADPNYRRVLAWIQSLDVIAPDYGIDITPKSGTP